MSKPFNTFKKDLYKELLKDPQYHNKMFGYYPHERDFFTSVEIKRYSKIIEGDFFNVETLTLDLDEERDVFEERVCFGITFTLRYA